MAQGLSYLAVRQLIFIEKENNMRYKIITYTLFLLLIIIYLFYILKLII